MVIDFEEWIKKDIDSGKFEKVLDAYREQRRKHIQCGQMPKREVFEDLGEYSPDDDLKSKIQLYRALMDRSRIV